MLKVNNWKISRGALAASFWALLSLTFIGAATAQARDTLIPTAEKLQQVVNEAYAKFKDVKDGKNADYIPILATVPQGQLYSPDSPPSDVRVTTTPALTLTCTKLTEPQSAIRVEP